jgi:hypothetical protein
MWIKTALPILAAPTAAMPRQAERATAKQKGPGSAGSLEGVVGSKTGCPLPAHHCPLSQKKRRICRTSLGFILGRNFFFAGILFLILFPIP